MQGFRPAPAGPFGPAAPPPTTLVALRTAWCPDCMLLVEVLRGPAVALPDVEESVQGDLLVFTVAGTVFLMVEESGTTAVLAVDEHDAGALVAGHQDLYEEVWSDDSEFVGVRVDLRRAPERRVAELVVAAWRNKAPRHLVPPPRSRH